MDAYNLMFIPWGYQIMVMSIDNLILALVIFALEIAEFAYYKRKALEEGELLKNAGGTSSENLFLKKKKDFAVMSGLPDSFDDDQEDDDSSMA